jgi:nucleolar pre-ribosomal-associated protein 1
MCYHMWDRVSLILVSYWHSAGLTLEPRLASKWLTNVAFVGSVISSPVPETSFKIATKAHASASSSREDPSMDYNPTPPPLHAITENVLPSSLTRVFLSKGLQHTSALVQHMTAILLIKSLTKLEKIAELLRRISSILQEDEERGLWRHRAHALEQDILRRLPDYRSIVTFVQNSQTISFVDEPRDGDTGASARAKQPATPRDADTLDVLSEAALRLLSLYQRCLPDAAAEVKFDSGKLLMLLDGVSVGDGQSEGYSRLRRLHVLRLLKNDPQFVWSNKAGESLMLSQYVDPIN